MTFDNEQVIVEDEAGIRYRLLKASEQSWLVEDIEEGQYRFLDPTTLDVVQAPECDGNTESSHLGDDTAIDIVLKQIEAGPISVNSLLDRTILCESTLHATLWALRSAGAVEECMVEGRRGYRSTTESRVKQFDPNE